jgi:hypothetical protein
MSAYESHIFDVSAAGPADAQYIVKSKSLIDVVDTNAQSYTNGQVVFSLESLVNSNAFLDMQNSFVTVPITMTLACTTAASLTAGAENAFAMSLKAGNHQLVNSMQLTMSGVEILSSQQMSAIPITYDLLTSWSRSDEDAMGASQKFLRRHRRQHKMERHSGRNEQQSLGHGQFADGASDSKCRPPPPLHEHVRVDIGSSVCCVFERR